MRDWARTDAALGEAFADADARRTAAIRAMFERHGFGADEADIRASAIYLTQVGYIALGTTESLERRLERIPTYIETFTGQRATEDELAVFAARHLKG